jgi:predicted acylesterase/phospholipase RssA
VKTAFVPGGGVLGAHEVGMLGAHEVGMLGAHEVGMLRALSEAGISPDIVVGTSVGAINGAFVAADPAGAAAWLSRAWQGEALQQAFSETILGQVARLARSGTHLYSLAPLREMLEGALPGRDFADLQLPFHCVAASIERASRLRVRMQPGPYWSAGRRLPRGSVQPARRRAAACHGAGPPGS